MQLLTQKNELILKEQRALLNDLRVALAKFGISDEDEAALTTSIRQLDEFFLLVVVGEFNAGKSAFINALLGKKLLNEGVTPTTTQVNLLKHGDEESRVPESEYLHILTAPIDFLKDLSIVDTPGTNAVIREHETITTDFIPRSDLVLFVTSADRPFSESERAFLEKIRDWGKKVVVVLNKIDILHSEEDLAKIQEFIIDNSKSLLSITPEIFPVSAHIALRAKQGEPQLWEESRFEQLENYIIAKLDEGSRLRLKLLNPLGVADALVGRYLKVTIERLKLLADDVMTLTDVEQQLAMYKSDMERDFEFRMSDVEKILLGMENRGQEYFDETIRLGRFTDLIKKDRIQKEFEIKVVADVPEQIETRVAEMIDWLVEADLKQWEAVTGHLSERRQRYKDRIVGGEFVGSFHYDRERLIDGVGRETRRVVEGYDKKGEARSIAEGVQNAVAATAVLEVGAVGLGVLVSAIATTLAADVTGILLASFLAILGFFVLPARRRHAKEEMRRKVAEMREKLSTALNTQFHKEIERSLQHITDAIGPYTRFVRSEQQKLGEGQSDLTQFKTDLARIRSQIRQRFPGE